MANIINKTFAPQQKTIKYLGKDFDQFKSNLIEFAKNYYSKTYQDFNDASPGMMYIDMASYVGDVLSFYTDYQFKEGILNYSEERKNVVNLAKFLGYNPRPTRPSTGNLDVFQIVPSKPDGNGGFEPDLRYALLISEGMEVLSSNKISFISSDVVDFRVDTIASPRVDQIFSSNDAGDPEFYLLKKNVNIYSGKKTTYTFNVGFTPNLVLSLPENNVIKITDVRDSDNNRWYQVDYLAQSLIMLPVENNVINFENYSSYAITVPSIIRLLRTNRRFITNVNENNITSLQFGSASDVVPEEVLIPSSELLGVGYSNMSKYNFNLDTANFINSSAYGTVPVNTTITVSYVIGGGILSNTSVDSITTISSIDIQDTQQYATSELGLVSTIKNSVRVNNPVPTVGGEDQESVFTIKQNAVANFATQNRTVTKEDYVASIFSMPSQYGSVAKAYVLTETDLYTNNTSYVKGLMDESGNIIVDETTKDYRKVNMDGVNSFGVNLYVLSYDENKNLTAINDALSYNLQQYLSQYRMLSDRINIIDGIVINIGVNFKILTYSNYNKKEVLSNCITAIQNFFNIEQWQFSQPININQLQLEIANTEGVQAVADLKIVNLTTRDGDYSVYEYDMIAATKNNIIYPPMDPSIFEVKNLDTDIVGSAL